MILCYRCIVLFDGEKIVQVEKCNSARVKKCDRWMDRQTDRLTGAMLVFMMVLI